MCTKAIHNKEACARVQAIQPQGTHSPSSEAALAGLRAGEYSNRATEYVCEASKKDYWHVSMSGVGLLQT